MTAAALAHGGSSGFGYLKLGSTLETADSTPLNISRNGPSHRMERFLNSKMFVTLFTYRGICGSRFGLDMPALWARNGDDILFWLRH
jgi:hypothetical protein